MKRKLEFSKSLDRLVKEFSKLPGVGPKTAERFAFHILRYSKEEVNNLSRAIIEAKEKLTYCQICGNLSEEKICQICQDNLRDKNQVCVVEEPDDVLSIEKTGVYKGLYHVLLGSIAPLEGIGPHELRVKELISRVKNNKIKEVIIATGSSTEGEMTALYLAKVLKPYKVKLSRLAAGMPVGAELDYADKVTLGKALENRISI